MLNDLVSVLEKRMGWKDGGCPYKASHTEPNKQVKLSVDLSVQSQKMIVMIIQAKI